MASAYRRNQRNGNGVKISININGVIKININGVSMA
jgi:hypothetical protein